MRHRLLAGAYLVPDGVLSDSLSNPFLPSLYYLPRLWSNLLTTTGLLYSPLQAYSLMTFIYPAAAVLPRSTTVSFGWLTGLTAGLHTHAPCNAGSMPGTPLCALLLRMPCRHKDVKHTPAQQLLIWHTHAPGAIASRHHHLLHIQAGLDVLTGCAHATSASTQHLHETQPGALVGGRDHLGREPQEGEATQRRQLSLWVCCCCRAPASITQPLLSACLLSPMHRQPWQHACKLSGHCHICKLPARLVPPHNRARNAATAAGHVRGVRCTQGPHHCWGARPRRAASSRAGRLARRVSWGAEPPAARMRDECTASSCTIAYC